MIRRLDDLAYRLGAPHVLDLVRIVGGAAALVALGAAARRLRARSRPV